MIRHTWHTKRKHGSRLGTAVMAVVLTIPSVSHALSVQVSDGTNTFTCADGGTCEAGSPTVDGLLTYSQAVGSWLATVTTGVTKPTIGSSLSPALQLTNVSVSGNFGSAVPTLTIKLSEQGFTTPNALNSFDFSSTATLNGMTGNVKAYFDNSNALFGTTSLLGSSPNWQDPNPTDTFAPAFSHNAQVSGNTVQPFSLTLIAEFSNPAAGVRNSSVTGTLNLVPIPAAVWLFGSALAGMGIIGRRKQVAA